MLPLFLAEKTISSTEKDELRTKMENKSIYLDSNIFMDSKYENIFEYLIENKIKVNILKSQYDEMVNLRKKLKNDESEKAKLLKSKLSLALKRIEELIDKTESNIQDIGFDSDKNAYADIDFIKTILKKLKKEESVIFVTQDRDLRIRLKTMIKDNKEINQENINIFDAEEFIEYVNNNKSSSGWFGGFLRNNLYEKNNT